MRIRIFLLCSVLLAGCGTDTTAPDPVDPPPPPEVPAAATAWLDANSIPFVGSNPSLGNEDVEFLRDLVGDARIVTLGENTHGTRDFFEMKARILRYLVEEMGFDGFAIEATWPEGNRLDRYVREGVGDPAELLSGLYFWTWNTESVLEMIEWLRAHNENGGDVGFYGFDMQYPGMALNNVMEYLADVDPEEVDEMGAMLECLARYANDPEGRFPDPAYASETAEYRTECGASLDQARDVLLARREAYEGASSAESFVLALRSLRVATQYHLMISGIRSRDDFMAENTVWLADQLGPDRKLVVWAHNFHVSIQPGAQGWFMRQTYGDQMVVVGFSHERGGFTAVTQGGSNLGLRENTLEAPLPLSYEHFLSTAAAPRFVLDLRSRETSDPATDWLTGPRSFRFIGCCYDPTARSRYWSQVRLTEWYDLLVHFRTTRATTVLPFRFPTEF